MVSTFYLVSCNKDYFEDELWKVSPNKKLENISILLFSTKVYLLLQLWTYFNMFLIHLFLVFLLLTLNKYMLAAKLCLPGFENTLLWVVYPKLLVFLNFKSSTLQMFQKSSAKYLRTDFKWHFKKLLKANQD